LVKPLLTPYFGKIRILGYDQETDFAVTFETDTFEAAAPSSEGLISVWTGAAWVEKPVKVWNGSSWINKPLKRWNGSSWIVT
jgi:hypothetical protein